MKSRADALTAYHNALNTLEARQQKLQSLTGVPGKNDKIPELQRGVAEAEQHAEQRLQELNTITAAARTEFGRFQQAKHMALMQMARNFVQIQLHASQQIAHVWGNILQEMDQSPTFQMNNVPGGHTQTGHHLP